MEKLRVYPNERVGLTDFLDGAGGELVFQDLLRIVRSLILPSGRISGSALTSGRIFSGFGWNPSITLGVDAQGTLILGTGIFPYFDGGDLLFGVVVGEEGPASLPINVSARPDGSYALYVKMEHTQGATKQNRVFWNPSGSPAAEFLDSVSPRDEATWDWDLRGVAAVPPGNGEWVKIWEIDVLAGKFNAIRDYRHWFFEGDSQASYGPDWGDGANDRDTDRSAYGITDIHQAWALVRRQLEDIIGLGGWEKLVSESNLQGLFPTAPASPVWDRVVQWQNIRNQEIYRYTPYGRLASTRRFEDDFFYHATNWGSTPADYSPNYVAVVQGSGSIGKARSAALMTALGAPGDETHLETDDHFLFRSSGPTNETVLSMYAHLYDILPITDVLVQVGFVDSGGNWRVSWVFNDGFSTNWFLQADDGVNPPVTNISIAAATGVTHLSLHINPFDAAGVGTVTASIDVAGTLNNQTLTLPGAGATFLGNLALRARIVTLDGTIKTMNLDYWTAWDENLHAGVLV